MLSSEQKVAVISGGALGIGRACAKRFAKDNYRLLVIDRSEDLLAETCQEIRAHKGSCLAYYGDIANELTSQLDCEKAISEWGRIDVLVANAGVQIGGELLKSSEEDWDNILGVNLKGVAYSCKAALSTMVEQERGSIVIISSINVLSGSAAMAIYDASKAAVLGLMNTNFHFPLTVTSLKQWKLIADCKQLRRKVN